MCWGRRRYGLGGEQGPIPEDKRRCVQAITQTQRINLMTVQCNKARGYGPGGEYCQTHAPRGVNVIEGGGLVHARKNVMAIISVDGVGNIETGVLPSGDMKIWHAHNDRIRLMVEPICRSANGYWNAKYNNWIVKKQHADSVIAELEKCGKRIS